RLGPVHASPMLTSRCTIFLLVGALLAAGSWARAQPAATTPAPTLAILLDLSDREIALLRDGKAVNRWPVVIGAPETPTPVGRFQVQTKVINPVYQSTSSGQVKGVGALGYRWIGFHNKGANAFGIHGTPWPWWVDARAAVSHGCVRMRNEHIEKLFAAVEIGTPVVIQP
ncbi:MAG: L,D-transpeptidase, partial [Vulcanococcus sp.]